LSLQDQTGADSTNRSQQSANAVANVKKEKNIGGRADAGE